MKKMIKAADNKKPNKRELRSQFVQLATSIRDMSKNEFVLLLKSNDFETAQNWIDSLQQLHDQFETQARNSISGYDDPYVCLFSAQGIDIGYYCKMFTGGPAYDNVLNTDPSLAKKFKVPDKRRVEMSISWELYLGDTSEYYNFLFRQPDNPDMKAQIRMAYYADVTNIIDLPMSLDFDMRFVRLSEAKVIDPSAIDELAQYTPELDFTHEEVVEELRNVALGFAEYLEPIYENVSEDESWKGYLAIVQSWIPKDLLKWSLYNIQYEIREGLKDGKSPKQIANSIRNYRI